MRNQEANDENRNSLNSFARAANFKRANQSFHPDYLSKLDEPDNKLNNSYTNVAQNLNMSRIRAQAQNVQSNNGRAQDTQSEKAQSAKLNDNGLPEHKPKSEGAEEGGLWNALFGKMEQ